MPDYARERGLQVDWIPETRAHADQLSGAHDLRGRIGGCVAIGEHVREVQAIFKDLPPFCK